VRVVFPVNRKGLYDIKLEMPITRQVDTEGRQKLRTTQF